MHGSEGLNLYSRNTASTQTGRTPRKTMSKLFARVVRPEIKKKDDVVSAYK